MAQPRLAADVADLESRTQAIGRELYDRVQGERRAFFESDRWTGALFDWALGMEDAKLQLFRFVDVLPALGNDADVARHLREYFQGRDVPFAWLVRLGLGLARGGWVGEKIVAVVLRQTVRHLARRFIAGTTADEAVRAARLARAAGQTFTVDVLGEACVSDDEALGYQRRYLELIERLGAGALRWTPRPALDQAPWGPLPRVNISVKLSALHPYLDPVDPAASAAVVRERLRPIVRAATASGAHIQVDMEERRLKDLTIEIFTELCEEPEFRGNPDLGVVLQAYLRDTEQDARRLVAWARRRGTPVTVRLVKGAYWDYETARARLERWPVPVWEAKPETDAAFERVTALLMDAPDAIHLAVASHNIRSVAHALALREALGLPQAQLEFQALYGMATPLVRALAERGERVRIYMPFGELIPGMAYLVRRLLENTSNESFLRRGFLEHEPPEVLLADPATLLARPEPVPTDQRGSPDAPSAARSARATPASRRSEWEGLPAGFASEPHTDFSLAGARERFATALAAVRRQFGRRYPLVIGGRGVETAGELRSLNPSCPGEVVGLTGSASAEDVDRAVQAADRAWPAWRDTSASARADVLGRVADLMRESRAELAAWIVYEAGKPWREADADVAEAIDFVEYYRRQAVELLEPRRLGRLPGEVNHYLREPRGVVGVIAPWNFPLAILTGMTAAALATGNTVLMKPAEQTPVIAAKLMELFEAAGLPPGVVNYVPGLGEIAGDRLVTHPTVRLIAFTGSLDVGSRIYAAAAQLPKGARHLKRVVAEMGGKNAVIVDDDADLDEAVQGIVASTFGYAGQKCSACSRVIAVGGAHDRLVQRLAEAARAVPMGRADEPGTIVGPVIDAASQERIETYIELGKRLGRPVLMREVPPALEALGGYYVGPAIFADVPAACPLAREEIFGPVLSVMRAGTFEDALEVATDIDFALTGGVFSRSPARLRLARERFRVGNLYINRAITGAMVGRQPFGGRQLSGLGYQAGGPDYLLQFVEGRVVTENTLRRGFASDQL
ncbi:MAG: bifunctional proline dehydrogenase/L-glutamate gamma-semialdehyde dehydrogenase [Candidatus Rokubacteria bacterium]|nr:bifunctional proline dehydrogenase/L-glutamate gamma-semialdehyde dehydrogenase [Candidatus Rokubacteria bacterium]